MFYKVPSCYFHLKRKHEQCIKDDPLVTAYLTRDEFEQLQLRPQQLVHIRPKKVVAFLSEEQRQIAVPSV